MDTTKEPSPTVRFDSQPNASAAAAMPAVPGYEVLALVGRGGMGKVYRARNLTLGRVVALKLLASEPDENLLARFREEVRAVAHLQHPNIAQLFETGVAEGQPYFTQEFLDGGSLAQSFDRKPQDPAVAARVVETIARAIQHSHEHGILHRDLKPANILLASDGTPKVTDFGLAKTFATVGAVEETTPHGSGLTRTGEILGTPSYMPPEQASGVLSLLGPASDVYGLGAILYEALTGRPPFMGPDVFRTVLMVREMEPISPRTLQPGVPRDLATVCLKCLAKEPRRRYPSAGELADDLRRFLNREPILARPVGRWERTTKWARRNPWQAAAAVLGVLLVVSLVVGLAAVAEKNRQVRGANGELARTNAELSAAKEKAEAEKDRAEQTLGIALYALDRYFFVFSDQLKELPRAEKLRHEVLTNARGTLDNLNRFQSDNARLQRFRMEGYDRLGNIGAQLGNPAAEGDYAKARDIARTLEAQFPDESEYRRSRLLATTKIAAVRGRRGDHREADALLESVLPETLALVAANPDNVGVLELELVVRTQALGREMRHGRWDGVEASMREMCGLYRRLAKVDADNPSRRLAVVDADRGLALLLTDLGKFDAAAAALVEASRGVAALPNPLTAEGLKIRAGVAATIAHLHQQQGLHRLAFVTLAATLRDYQQLATEFPGSHIYRYRQGETLWAMCVSAGALGDAGVAVRYLERAEKLLAALVAEHPADATYRAFHADLAGRLKPKQAQQKPE